MDPWQRLSSRDIIRDRWVRLRADRCRLPSGQVIDPYYVMEEGEWVHVFATDARQQVLLVRQYRYAANVTGYELPGGNTVPGEDLLAAVQREFLEETGCIAEHWRPLAAYHANPARQDNRVHLFLADHARIVSPQRLDDTEAITVEFVPPARVLELIRAGGISQATHIGLIYTAFSALGWLQPTPPAG